MAKGELKLLLWAVGTVLLLMAAAVGSSLPHDNSSDLTPDQKLAITADCKDHPDALRCL